MAQPFHPCYRALTSPTVFRERDGRGQEPRAPYPGPEQFVGSDSQRPPVHSEGIGGGFCGVKHFRCCEIQKKRKFALLQSQVEMTNTDRLTHATESDPAALPGTQISTLPITTPLIISAFFFKTMAYMVGWSFTKAPLRCTRIRTHGFPCSNSSFGLCPVPRLATQNHPTLRSRSAAGRCADHPALPPRSARRSGTVRPCVLSAISVRARPDPVPSTAA